MRKGAQTKNTIIEGWLKKVKEKAKNKSQGNTNKRWFALDIVNAIFTYANGKNKKASKTIPLRDILDFSANEEATEIKDWDYYFTVLTRDREYCLFAPTRSEKEMWVHAFRTILKYKHKADEDKRLEEEGGGNRELEIGMENEGFEDVEEEGEGYEEVKVSPRRNSREEGDFMEANTGQIQERNFELRNPYPEEEGKGNLPEHPNSKKKNKHNKKSNSKGKKNSK